MKKVLPLIVLLLAPLWHFAQLNGFYNQTKQGLNFAEASVPLAQRIFGFGVPQPAPLNIMGIPAGATIEKAYLYWAVEGVSPTNSVTLENPDGNSNNYAGTMIGSAPGGKCWGRPVTQHWRADVTAAVSGNGIYLVSGLPGTAATSGADTDGATLIIIYSDCAASYKGTLVIDDGISLHIGVGSAQALTGFTAPAGVMNSRTFCLLSDFQNIGASTLTINGGPVPFVQEFWDWEEGNLPITAGQTTVGYSVTTVTDCYSWILIGAYYQECNVPLDTILAATACAGTPTSFGPLFCGAPDDIVYDWSGDDGFASTDSAPSYVYPSGAGSYNVYLEVTDTTNGCLGIDTTIAFVDSCGTPPVADFIASRTDICVGDCIDFTDLSSSVPDSWSWSFAGAAPSGSGQQHPQNICYNMPGSYDVELIVSNANGADTLLKPDYITVYPDLTVDAGNDTAICSGTSAQLGGNPTATGGAGNYQYIWSPGDYLNNTTIANPVATPTTSIDYILTVTDNVGCSRTDSVTVTIAGAADAGSDLSACADDTLKIGGFPTGPEGSVFSWSPSTGLDDSTKANPMANPADTTMYVVTVTDTATGCQDKDTMMYAVQVVAEAIPDQAVICPGDSVQLNASGGDTYSWSPEDGLSDPDIPDPVAGPEATTTYVVTVSGGFCEDRDTVEVIVSTPEADFNYEPTCAGMPMTFYETGSNAAPVVSWVWDFGDGNTAADSSPVHIYTDAGTYQVTLTVSNGKCEGSVTKAVEVSDGPKAAFQPDPAISTTERPTVRFTDMSTGAQNWLWNFGNGDASMDQHPQYLYPDTGKYLATLVVTDQYGCMDTVTALVVIFPPVSFALPNAFTPNGDDLNEVFKPEGNLEGVKDYEMRVWNRWGEQVFASTDKQTGWNGRRNNTGAQAITGTYFYQVKVMDFISEEHTYSGYIYLIR